MQLPKQWNAGLEKAIFHLEEPLGDSTILPSLHLFEATSRSVKVALSGEGADEVLGGYAHQNLLALTHPWRNRLSFLRGGISSLLSSLQNLSVKNPFYPIATEPEMYRRMATLSQRPPDLASDHLLMSSLFTAQERKLLLSRSLGDEPLLAHSQKVIRRSAPTSYQQGLLALDLEGWLADYGLHRVDRLSMAHGLEVRVPFLQHRLVESIYTARPTFSWRQRKKQLREYAQSRPRLAHHIGRRKHPLHFPLDQIAQQSLVPWANNILTAKRMGQFEILSSTGIRTWMENFQFSYLNSKKLFWLTSFQLWSEMLLDTTPKFESFGALKNNRPKDFSL